MQHIYLTWKTEQLKEKEKKLKMNFLTMTSMHKDTYADLAMVQPRQTLLSVL